MASVLDVPALQGPPDISTALQMLSEGLQERRKNREDETKRLLAQNIGGRLSSGDFQGAAGTAFAAGDIGTGLKIHEMDIASQAKTVEMIGQYAQAAQTPEQWDAYVNILDQKFPGQNIKQEWGGFDKRDAAIAETTTIAEQLAQQAREDAASREDERLAMERERLRIAQEEAAGGAKPPTGYKRLPDGTLTFEPRGPADPEVIRQQAEARTTAKAVKPTEREARNAQLYMVMEPELKTVTDNFSSLSNILNQGAQATPLVRGWLTSSGYQQARNSLRTIVASYLYSVSGATANPGEVETQTDVLMPKVGEKKASLEDKLSRIKTMVEAVKQGRGNYPDLTAGPAVEEDANEEQFDEDAARQAFIDAGGDPEAWQFVEDKEVWR